MTIGAMSKCAFESPCEKLVSDMHRNDILLGGREKLIRAWQASPRERFETQEQLMGERQFDAKLMGERPFDAKQVVMLNRKDQWTREIREV